MFWKFETVGIELKSANRKKLQPVGNKENVIYCVREVNFCTHLGIILSLKYYAAFLVVCIYEFVLGMFKL